MRRKLTGRLSPSSRWGCHGVSLILVAMCLLGDVAVVLRCAGSDVVRGGGDGALLWASSGGGWRAMAGSMGFANLFYQIGLISPDSSLLDGGSYASGSAWFALQFFYSRNFFDRTLIDDPADLRTFVLEWASAYQTILPSRDDPFDDRCSPLLASKNIPPLDILSDQCELHSPFDWDWAGFIQRMYNVTSTIAFDDPDFKDRELTPENKVAAMKNTDMFVQMALAANSRVGKTHKDDTDVPQSPGEIIYLGGSDVSKVYGVPIPLQYAVTAGSSGTGTFVYGTDDGEVPFTSSTRAPDTFSFEDWDDFAQFPPGSNDGVMVTLATAGGDALATPFSVGEDDGTSGIPTATQIGSASSAAASVSSFEAGSFAMSFMSLFSYKLENSELEGDDKALAIQLFDTMTNDMYATPLMSDLSVCSQWPHDCTYHDGRLLDGSFIDDTGLSQAVGNFHGRDDGDGDNGYDMDKTLKVILTDNNQVDQNNARILSCFRTDFNQDVNPGGFIWPPPGNAIQEKYGAHETPIRSYQIFQEYHDEASIEALLEPVEGSDFTTAYLQGTTLVNPAYGTKAGQKVDILYIRINSAIPSIIMTQEDVEDFKDDLAVLAREIARNDELQSRVREFLLTEGGTYAPTPSPDSSAHRTMTMTRPPSSWMNAMATTTSFGALVAAAVTVATVVGFL